MGSYSELIKKFDKTRDFIHDFFIYGLKVRNEYTAKSSRTYDDEKRRCESWLGDYFKYTQTSRGKQSAISVDSGKIFENPLYNAYYSKSFTSNSILAHFLILDILCDNNELDQKEICDMIARNYNCDIDEQIIKRKLKEYEKEGIVNIKKLGKKNLYSLSEYHTDKIFKKFPALVDMLKCFSENTPFGVIGNSILKSMNIKNDLFLHKHYYIVHTLEDEILLEIISAMREHRNIVITNFGKKTINDFLVYPLKIYVSTQTGRRYLIAYFFDRKRLTSFRLDAVKSVKKENICIEYQNYKNMLERNKAKCFGVSFGTRKGENDVEHIEFVIRADEEREPYIIQRLEREKRYGTVERIDNGLYKYSADVFDIQEMIPWIRTFIGRIVSIYTSDPFISKKFKRDIFKMADMYDTENQKEKILI